MSELMILEYIALGAAFVLVALLLITMVRRRRGAPPPVAKAEPEREAEAVAYLERPGGVPHTFPLSKPVIAIGRGEHNDIRVGLDIPGARSVSRRHAQIRREDLDYIVEDLASENGIRVNGLATHRNLLRDGYYVSFGSVEFVFRMPQPRDASGTDS